MDTQYKKGVLELCVLATLHKKDQYGYELISKISKSVLVSEGTIYPLLRRLKQDGLLTTYLEESSEGPSRKYYQLTADGKKAFLVQKKEWEQFSKKVNMFLGEQ